MRNARYVVCAALAVAACGDNIPGNNPPELSAAQLTTPEDTPISVTLTAVDPEGGALTFTFSSAAHGTITLDGPNLTYRPEDDYHGPDAVVVTVDDGEFTASATISITVTPLNDAPVAANDALAASEDTAATVTAAALVANDTDVDGDPLTVTAVGNAVSGTVGLVAGTVTFTPAANFVGTATFDYTVSDGNATDDGTVTVTVGGQNDPPVAVDDTATTAEDTNATITAATLVANDTDDEGQTLSVTAVSGATNGTVSLTAGTITFIPGGNFNGTAGFDYTVTDGAGTDTGHVTVTVTPVNDTPVANAQSQTTAEDTPIILTLTATDVDLPAQTLVFSVVTGPTAGTLGTITQVTATSATVTYTPTLNSTAADSFTFRVNDGTIDSAPATVSITVTPVNDPPVASGQAVMTNEDVPLTITLTGSDTEGSALTFAVVTGPTAGALGTITQLTPTSASVTYTPTLNSTTDDSFTFRVTDTGTANSAPATVSIDVVPVDDPPVAAAQSVSTDEDTALQITLSATDVDTANLTFAIATGPTAGTLGTITQLTPTTARVTYTPTLNSTAADSFTFRANDGNSDSAPATISITVNALDDRPVASAQSVSTDEDLAVLITLTGSDVEGASLTFAIGTGPATGTLGTITQLTPTSAQVTYTPNLNSNAADSFTFTATGGGQTSLPATVGITINPINDPPVAVTDGDTAQKNTPMVRATSAYFGNDTDVDGPALSITAVGSAVNGTVDLVATTITFTPALDYTGPASFQYTVTDGFLPVTGTVNVNVLETNTPPIAVTDTYTIDEDTPETRASAFYTGNDIDPDPGTLTITAVQNPIGGAVILAGGDITFTPTADLNGNDVAGFEYVVFDGIASATGQVVIDINPIDDLPVANNDLATVDEDSALNLINVLTNDVLGHNPAIGDQPVAVTVPVQPTNGAAFVNVGNAIVYTPNNNFAGTDSITYVLTDGDGDTSTATVTVTVNNLNDPPTANNASVSLNENATTTINLTGSDIDLPVQPLTFTVGTPPQNGVLGAITSTGPTTATVGYTPTANYTGPDSFTFTVNDGVATSTAGTITITVNNVVVCNDGLVELPETCDDQGNGAGDGCSPTCQTEPGWTCSGAPSACDPICNDGILIAGEEECDDGNPVQTDGCTTLCQAGPVCTVGIFAGGARFATDPTNGHCFVSYDFVQTTWDDAQLACVAVTGHLATITNGGEQLVAASVQNPDENPWIGGTDALVEGSFGWITGEPFVYTNYSPGQPDGGEPEDCLNMFSVALATPGTWNDTACNFIGFTRGRICEIEINPCGDGVVQAGLAEACDDGNTNNFDGCSRTCQVEPGAVCSGSAPTTCAKLVINEVEYDNQSTDNTGGQFEFVEILNAGTAPADLVGIAMILFNANVATPTEYFPDGSVGIANIAKRVMLTTAGLPGNLLPPGGIIVVAPAGLVVPGSAAKITIAPGSGGWLQNGAPDAIGLYNLTVPATPVLVDGLSYEGNSGNAQILGASGTTPVTEGTGHAGDPAPTGGPYEGLSRVPNARDTQNNATDFALRPVSPGLANP